MFRFLIRLIIGYPSFNPRLRRAFLAQRLIGYADGVDKVEADMRYWEEIIRGVK